MVDSPAQDVVSALVMAGLLFFLAAAVLRRYHLAVQEARHEREMELLEQLAQPGDRMSQVEAPSETTLQAKDGLGGMVAGAALAAHSSLSIQDGVQ